VSHKVLRIVALLAAMVAAPALAGIVHLEPGWLDLLASAAIGAMTGLTVLFIFRRLPLEDDTSNKTSKKDR
jgi:hypothetical protein